MSFAGRMLRVMRGSTGAESGGILTPELVTARKCCDGALVNLKKSWMGRVGEVRNVGEPGFERVWVASYLFLEREDGSATLHGVWHVVGQLLLKMICALT